MTVVVYVSVNQSFNPFTVTISRAGRRASLDPAASQAVELPSRRHRARRTTGAPIFASATQIADRSAGEILAMLPALARTVAEDEADFRGWVVRLRDLGIGWDLIGAAIQLGDEDVRRRFEAEPSQ